MCAAFPTGCTPLASVGDPDCLLTVQKYNIGLTPEVSRVKKMQKNALFYGNGSVCGCFLIMTRRTCAFIMNPLAELSYRIFDISNGLLIVYSDAFR